MLTDVRLNIPSQAAKHTAHVGCSKQPHTMCEGFSHHRMQFDWEKLGYCDLKSFVVPAEPCLAVGHCGTVWDTVGQCHRQIPARKAHHSRGLGSGLGALCPADGKTLAILAGLGGHRSHHLQPSPATITCNVVTAAALHIPD